MSDLSLSPRAFRAVLLVLGLLGPLPFLADVARHPLELVPCGPPPGSCQLGDAAIATSVLGRAWSRFERGEAWNRDDRVFAPYPDSWGLSEGYLAEAIVGYPWARLSGSPAAGYNVAYALACVFAFWSAGALFLRLAGPGWPALVGALLFTWSQGRLNSVGVLSVLWAGLVPLAIAFGLDVLRRGRWRDALLFGATWLAIGMGSLSGLLMGAITAGLVLAACGLVQPARRRRLPLLLVAGAVAAFPLVLVHRPLFRLARDFDVKVSMRTFEGQSADLASLLHHSGFSVPLKAVFDGLLPGFPPGSPGFFPGLFALTVGGSGFSCLASTAPSLCDSIPLAPKPTSACGELSPPRRSFSPSARRSIFSAGRFFPAPGGFSHTFPSFPRCGASSAGINGSPSRSPPASFSRSQPPRVISVRPRLRASSSAPSSRSSP